jgi:hypothetical protein
MLNRRFSLARKPHPKVLHLIFIAALLTVALGTAPAKPVQAEPVPLAGAVSPGGLLNPDGTLNTTTGFQGTLDLRGWEVTLDGEHGPLLKQANSPAYTPLAWDALPNQGLNGEVYALALSGTDLYVGGDFDQTGDGSLTHLGNIARYDTSAGTWHALTNQGLNGNIYALTLSGTDLGVGGWFGQTGDGSLTNLGNIAHYDTSAGTWDALPNQGLNGYVYALTLSGTDLGVGGDFDQTGDGSLTNLGNIAHYDTKAGTWHALPNQGLNGDVRALTLSGTDLGVGGDFDQTGDGSLTNLGNIAHYDTTAGTWHALPNQGLNGSVYALALSGTDLGVGGDFTQTGDGSLTNLGNIAHYDTSAGTWHTLPNQGLNNTVKTLVLNGNDLYVGGGFTQTGDGTLKDLGNIARCTPVENVYLPLVVR